MLMQQFSSACTTAVISCSGAWGVCEVAVVEEEEEETKNEPV